MKKLIVSLALIFFVLSDLAFAFTTGEKNTAAMLTRLKLEELKLKNSKAQALSLKTAKPMPEKKNLPSARPLEFGISLGLLANIPGACAELRWNQLFDNNNLSVKTGLMYADGNDANGFERKHALIFADGLWRLSQLEDNRVGIYIGGGLNYLVLTTGRVSGAVAGETYAGLDSKMGRNETLFVEMGFGAIRTGVSPSYKGLNAVLGYRNKI